MSFEKFQAKEITIKLVAAIPTYKKNKKGRPNLIRKRPFYKTISTYSLLA